MLRKPLKTLLAATIMLGMGGAKPALAWGELGHRTIANIAGANISPQTSAAIDGLLQAEKELGTPKCPVKSLADASAWPDCLRGESWRWAYTFPWHFHDSDINGPGFDIKGNCSYGACATAQITREKRVLADKSLPIGERLQALAFLVHIVGDLHQPLHAAEHAHDAGGNAVSVGNLPGAPYVLNTTPPTVVDARPKPPTLHWMWDNVLVERAQKAGQLPEIRAYSAQDKARIATGGVGEWAQESWQIAHDTVYPQAFGKVVNATEPTPTTVSINDAALDADMPIVRQRLLQAGLRLARMLDEALGGASQ